MSLFRSLFLRHVIFVHLLSLKDFIYTRLFSLSLSLFIFYIMPSFSVRRVLFFRCVFWLCVHFQYVIRIVWLRVHLSCPYEKKMFSFFNLLIVVCAFFGIWRYIFSTSHEFFHSAVSRCLCVCVDLFPFYSSHSHSFHSHSDDKVSLFHFHQMAQKCILDFLNECVVCGEAHVTIVECQTILDECVCPKRKEKEEKLQRTTHQW